jgi:hypothetical protein
MMGRTARETVVGTIPSPLISEADYPTFRLLLDNQIPASFAEWRQEADKEDHVVSSGNSVKRIAVTPQEFVGYCLSNRLHPTTHNLKNCAAAKYGCQRP